MKKLASETAGRSRPLFVVLALLVVMFEAGAAPARNMSGGVADYILKRCEYLEQFRKVPVCSTCVASQITIPKFYMDRNYTPAWTSEKLVKQMVEAIKDSYGHGLNPEDYHLSAIRGLRKKIREAQAKAHDIADLDVLLTDALLRLSFHLYYGKVSPESLDPNWNFKRKILDRDPALYLERVISSGNVTKDLNRLWPHHPYYTLLRAYLKKYRRFARNPWPRIPFKRTLKPGMKGPDVALLRTRLAAEEFFKEKTPAEQLDIFDELLEKAVKDFQIHHGLEPDGIVGKNTNRVLNQPPSFEINKIRVNLERARWILHDLPPKFLLVNIAAFKLFYFEDGKKKWSCKVMVGKPFWKTPIFRATVEYVVLNPYWVVPPGILRKEIIPQIKRNPGYLEKNNMEIVDAKGRWINPRSINWKRMNPDRFPYIIRQKPGHRNALGRIKFIFPNNHFVFLHDTPAKALFSRNIRAFSHGCIRVEKPIELAGILFKGSRKWTIEKIKEEINTGKNKIIHLERKMPILILYWTVVINQNNTITFLKDIYNRDRKILLGLDTPLNMAFENSRKAPIT